MDFGFTCSTCGPAQSDLSIDRIKRHIICITCGTMWSDILVVCPYCGTYSLYRTAGRTLCRRCGRQTRRTPYGPHNTSRAG